MANYLIGDIHGRYLEFMQLLKNICFDFKNDTLWSTGDVVFKGNFSFKTLKFLYKNRKSIKIVLGNHEIKLINLYYEGFLEKNSEFHNKNETKKIILWLKKQPFFRIDKKNNFLISHAGIHPHFHKIKEIKKISNTLEFFLKNKTNFFLNHIMKKRKIYKKSKKFLERLQFYLNSFIYMRYCFSDGSIDTKYKDIPENTPNILKPWFIFESKIFKKYSIIFGHWSTLYSTKISIPKNIYCLDTGCCWGGKLSILKWESKKIFSIFCK
ncbi:symmetrical bis(5'-nucleosyl)-tetraphosphatase [bacterium endosymbiont of Pedicinus badii]|uniref:symmetrical bis(5'-nucleosyl)-tetraphosphatase n=1 Tax=bacterium endosymbiont of Pedicinus badii TaxID=1719126 RepID=UPI0009BC515E|nr:symmetrical bis(5'-nucleosyl)-tetraphosphatase [bacterium endosymbiont of Pedicinus badii]OQM34206.1 hypothetical protein AOQ89_02640 [bacterium endosymbiont of Pedicinus badii]